MGVAQNMVCVDSTRTENTWSELCSTLAPSYGRLGGEYVAARDSTVFALSVMAESVVNEYFGV